MSESISLETDESSVSSKKKTLTKKKHHFEWKSSYFTKMLAFSITLGKQRSGYSSVVFNETQNFMISYFNWNDLEKEIYPGIITSISTLGAMFGMLLGLNLIRKQGRKYSSLIIDITAIVGTLISLIATPETFIIGRFIQGLANGGDSILIPIYLKEIASNDKRGYIMGMSSFSNIIGVIISYTFDLGLPKPDSKGVYHDIDNQWWRFQFCFPIIFSILRIAFVNLVFNFETPMFIYQTTKLNREHKAKHALSKLVKDEFIPQYYEEVVCETQECRNRKFVTLKELFGFAYKRASILLPIMSFFVILSGNDMIMAYIPRFISSGSIDIMLQRGLKIVIGFLILVSSAVNMLTSDIVGRRKFMVIGGVFSSFFGFLLFAINKAFDDPFVGNILVLYTYLFINNLTVNPSFYTYFAEVLPEIGVLCQYLFIRGLQFAFNFSFPIVLREISKSGSYLMFALGATFACIFAYLFLPPTKNRPYSKIFASFHGNLFVFNMKK